MASWQSSPFAGATIDFSQIGNLYDAYANAQASTLQRENLRQNMAYQQAQRGKAAAEEAALKSVLGDETLYDANGGFNAQGAATKLIRLGDVKGAQAVMGLEADRQKIATGPTTDDIKEYQFYSAQEKAAGRDPVGAMDFWKSKRVNASGGMFGKTGAVVQSGDGQFYTVQFGADGTRRIEPLQTSGGASSVNAVGGDESAPPVIRLSPSRGVETVGNQVIDKATGQPVRDVSAAIEGGEASKVRGRTQAEGEAALPKAGIALQQDIIQNNAIVQDINRAAAKANAWTTGLVGSQLSKVAGTDAYDLNQLLTGIQANLGFDRLQQMRENSPTGGALGSVTERETSLLQATWGSLLQSQSKEQFLSNLNRLRQIKQQFAQLKQQAYDADVKRFGASRVPNPTTGSVGGSGAPMPPATNPGYGTRASGNTQAAPVRVRSKAEARSLPRGSTFIDPNGVIRTVP